MILTHIIILIKLNKNIMQIRSSSINKQKNINLKKRNTVQLTTHDINPIKSKYDMKLEKSIKEKDRQETGKIRKNTADLSFNDTVDKENENLSTNYINSSIFNKDRHEQGGISNNKKNLNLTTTNITSAEINLNLKNYVNPTSSGNTNNLVNSELKSSLSKKRIPLVGSPIINKLNKVCEKTLDHLSIKDVYFSTIAQLQNLQFSPSRKNSDSTKNIKHSPKKISGSNLRNSWGGNNLSVIYDPNITNLSSLNYPAQNTSEGESAKVTRKLTGDFSQLKNSSGQGNMNVSLNSFNTPYSTSNKSKSFVNAFSKTPMHRDKTPSHKNEKFDNFRLEKNHKKNEGEKNDSKNNMNISFSPKPKNVVSSSHMYKNSANEVLENKFNLNVSSISAKMNQDRPEKSTYKTKNEKISNLSNCSKLETFKLQIEKLEMTLNEVRNSTEEVHEKLVMQEQIDGNKLDLSNNQGQDLNSYIKLKISDYNEIYSMVKKLKKEIIERVGEENNLLSLNSNTNYLSSPSRNNKNQSFFKSKINPFVEKIERMEKINELKKSKNLSSVNITNTFNIFHAPKSTNTSATGINFQVPLPVPVVNIKQKINTPLIVNKKVSKFTNNYKKSSNESPKSVKKQILHVDNNLSNNVSYAGNNSYISKEPVQSDYLFSTPKIHKSAKENIIGIEVPMQRLELKLNDENVENLLLLKQSERDEINDIELNSSILDLNCTEPQENDNLKNYEINNNPVVYSKSVSLNIKNPGFKLNLNSAEKDPNILSQSFNKPGLILNLESLPKYDFNDEFMKNAEEFSPSWREGCRKINLLK
jgi:hypothetical protein